MTDAEAIRRAERDCRQLLRLAGALRAMRGYAMANFLNHKARLVAWEIMTMHAGTHCQNTRETPS